MIKCFIFDLDGTLLDTLGTITYYVNEAISAEGLAPITEDECRLFIGNGAQTLIRRSLAYRGVVSDGVLDRTLKLYKLKYEAAPVYKTKPYDGISDALLALSKRGIKIGVISNKQHEAVVPTVKHFFGDLADAIAGGKSGVALKPAPDSVYAMMRELGVTAEETVFVGDTAVDIETGKAAGLNKTVGVPWGFRDRTELESAGADLIVSHPCELISEVLG